MKKFSMSHLFFVESLPEEFTEYTAPDWLVSKVYKWWFDDYVLKLKVGESIESDFRKITRIR